MSTGPSKWVPRERDFAGERKTLDVQPVPAPTDPLLRKNNAKAFEQGISSTPKASSVSSPLPPNPLSPSPKSPTPSDPLTSSQRVLDPLSAMAASATTQVIDDPLSMMMKSASSPAPVVIDPLSAAAAASSSSSSVAAVVSSSSSSVVKGGAATPGATAAAAGGGGGDVAEEEFVADRFVSWNQRKAQIIQKYSTSAQISVPSFVSGDLAKSAKAATSSSKSRLEQMDDDEDSQGTLLRYSQKEYISHMEELNAELARAWEKEERVRALKMAIQCAKLLGDSTLPQFYPSMFVLITEILDTFGRLVFQRIKQKGLANPAAAHKKEHEFVPSDVTEEARETCRNWFFKIASIRELLPRIYVEMSIMRCYQFLTDRSDFNRIFPRIESMLRGIADPLVATYARCYLARRGWEIMPDLKTYLHNGWNDFTFTFKDIYGDYWKNRLSSKHQLTVNEYIELLSPGISYSLQCLAHKCEPDIFRTVLADYASSGRNNPTLLIAILSAFPSSLISPLASNITPLIRESDAGPQMKADLYATLGRCLVEFPPPQPHRLPLLNEIWKFVAKLEDPATYLSVARVYIEYVIKYFSDKEVNVLLRDLVRHLTPNRAYTQHQDELEYLGLHLIRSFQDFPRLVGIEQFLPFLDLFVGRAKVQVAKSLLESFAKIGDVTTDAVLIHSAFDMAKILHDSVDSLSFQDEVRQISRLICQFVRKIDFGNDLEQHLNFFVDCRRFFVNIDAVKETLVTGVLKLVTKTHKIVNGQHTKRTMNFVKACLAFCHITIPSIDCRMLRLNLFLLCGQIALVNNTLAQADTFFRTAITLIPDLQIMGSPPPESELVTFFANFASTFVVVPGHPDHGPFFIIKGLLNVIRDYNWDPSSGNRIRVYLSMLVLFSTLAQSQLPYYIDRESGRGVESNDVLYACEGQYMNELQSLVDLLLEEILSELAAQKNSGLALELLNRLLGNANLTPVSATLAYDLFSLAKKGAQNKEEQAYLKNTLTHVVKMGQTRGKLHQELARRLQAVA